MRHAVYFAPPADSLLHRLGSAWLGRDALAGRDLPPASVAGLPAAAQAAKTRSARRYGLHATLKPPFRLAAGREPAALAAAVAELAGQFRPVEIGLRLARIAGFFALVPAPPVPPALPALAAACVERLDGFRAAPDAAELARRRAAGLTPRQEGLLRRWGYPYVMEEFRFHITLTDQVPAGEAETLEPILAGYFAPVLDRPLPVDALSLFVEPEEAAPLLQRHRFPLSAAPAAPVPDGIEP